MRSTAGKLQNGHTGIEQPGAEVKSIDAGETDDEILLGASTLFAEHRRMLADVERKLREVVSAERIDGPLS